jgi:hypothetical protein
MALVIGDVHVMCGQLCKQSNEYTIIFVVLFIEEM